ncbi:MAG: MupG family TIM beta-alpha barrel fold protein [Collinsella sp.]
MTSDCSGVCRLGISLYPEFASQEDNFAYLRRAAEHGFDVLFLALLGAKGTYEEVVERYLPYTRLAHELGFEIFCDVNPMVLKRLGVGISMFQGGIDLTFFKELGIDAMRLDLGMSDLEEAALAKNADGIKICITRRRRDRTTWVRCSPAVPRARRSWVATTTIRTATLGVSLDYFMRGTEHWAKRGMRLQAFVSSNAPGGVRSLAVTEGLPTLEMHRDLPIEVQLKHFVMMGCVGDVLIGNCFATDDELAAMERANSDRVRFTTRLVNDLPGTWRDVWA